MNWFLQRLWVLTGAIFRNEMRWNPPPRVRGAQNLSSCALIKSTKTSLEYLLQKLDMLQAGGHFSLLLATKLSDERGANKRKRWNLQHGAESWTKCPNKSDEFYVSTKIRICQFYTWAHLYYLWFLSPQCSQQHLTWNEVWNASLSFIFVSSDYIEHMFLIAFLAQKQRSWIQIIQQDELEFK